MAEHQCKCRNCQPEAFPVESLADTPQGGNHFAVRFGTRNFVLGPFLNGEFIERCPEVMAGEDGWAIMFGKHACKTCGDHICESVVTGHIEIRGTREAA
jgi:hypothetical protein